MYLHLCASLLGWLGLAATFGSTATCKELRRDLRNVEANVLSRTVQKRWIFHDTLTITRNRVGMNGRSPDEGTALTRGLRERGLDGTCWECVREGNASREIGFGELEVGEGVRDRNCEKQTAREGGTQSHGPRVLNCMQAD